MLYCYYYLALPLWPDSFHGQYPWREQRCELAKKRGMQSLLALVGQVAGEASSVQRSNRTEL